MERLLYIENNAYAAELGSMFMFFLLSFLYINQFLCLYALYQ